MRDRLPAMVIVTNGDSRGDRHTREGPSGVILRRMVGLTGIAVKRMDDTVKNASVMKVGEEE